MSSHRSNWNNRLRILWIAIVSLSFVSPVRADDDEKKKERMSFRNNVLEGHITVHKLTWRTQRKTPRRDYIESLTAQQKARWVQANLAAPDVNSATIYQMMELFPAAILSVSHGSEVLRALPHASEFNMDAGGTYLQSMTRTPKDSPFKPPQCDPAQETVLAALMDVAHWGKRKIEAGHRWQRRIDLPWFRGSQQFVFQGIEDTPDGKVGVVTYYVDGRFEGPLHQTHKFGKGQGALFWSASDRCLVRLDSRAEYERIRPTGNEEFEIRVETQLMNIASLDSAQTEMMRQQISVFGDALSALRRDNIDKCRDIARQFRDKWPNSIWLPAVNELQIQAAAKLDERTPLSLAEVSNRLTEYLVTWAATMREYDYDLQDRTRAGYLKLLAGHRAGVLKLTESENSKTRAKAVFALAFSPDPADFQTLQKAVRDSSSRVRGMALAAIAARRDPRTSPELLLHSLKDTSGGVRARACEAIGSCIVRENLAVDTLARALGELVKNDPKANVRRAATRSLALIGIQADIKLLEEALLTEENEQNRAELKDAISRLKEYDGR